MKQGHKDSRQRVALYYLVAGLSGQEAARLAGVHEVTVSRWRRHDGDFAALRRQVAGMAARALGLTIEGRSDNGRSHLPRVRRPGRATLNA
jgi:hypothetical protein